MPAPGDHLLRCCLMLALTVLCGCGSSEERLYPVRGRIQFSDGTPLHGGVVEFTSKSGQSTAIGAVGSDGTFQLTTKEDGDGAIAGAHDVIVVPGNVPIGGAGTHAVGPRVPKRYSAYDTSGITVDVPVGGVDDVLIVIEPK